jgi:hypothetical protein
MFLKTQYHHKHIIFVYHTEIKVVFEIKIDFIFLKF